MREREKTIAAALFLATALLFPVIFSAGSEERKPDPRMARFILRSALLELRLETALELYSPPAEEGAEGKDTATSEEALDFFSPQLWLETAAEMPTPERRLLLSQLAVACLAVGKDKEAGQLTRKLLLDTRPDEPFAYLLGEEPKAGDERLAGELEASDLPDWVTGLVLARFGPDGTGGSALAEEAVGDALAPWAARATLFFGGMLLLFLVGLVLLAMVPRILARYRREESILERGMFGAPPIYTYLIFAAWFVLTSALGMSLTPLLKEFLSPAQVILLSYVVSAVIGVVLVVKRGMMRTANLAVAVDLDRSSATPRNLALGIGGYVVAVPTVAFLTIVSTALLGGGEEGLNPAIPLLIDAAGGLDFWLLVMNVSLLAPLFEEFLFRGFLFQQFRRFFALPNAILLSAAVFAAVHLSIESFLPLFGLGILLAGVYHTTRSLWAAMITHGLWNFGTVMAVMVLFGS